MQTSENAAPASGQSPTYQAILWKWLQFAAGLVVLLALNHRLLDLACWRNSASWSHWLTHHAGDEHDIVLLGSSAVVAGLDASALAEMSSASIVNLARQGTSYAEQALILELYLKRNHGRVLLLEVDTWGLSQDGYSYPFHEYHYLPYASDPAVHDCLADYYGSARTLAWQCLPMLKYAEFNDKIGRPDIVDILQRRAAYVRKSKFKPAAAILAPEEFFASHPATTYAWDERQAASCRRIVEMARHHRMQVVMFVAPVYREQAARETTRERALAFYRDLATEFDVPLHAFDNEPFVAEAASFADVNHLNRRGAERLTSLLAERLRAHESVAHQAASRSR